MSSSLNHSACPLVTRVTKYDVSRTEICLLQNGSVAEGPAATPDCSLMPTQHRSQVKDIARRNGIMDGRLAPLVSFASGAMAGAAATAASYPFDLLRTTLAAQGEPKVCLLCSCRT